MSDTTDDRTAEIDEFFELVNMTPRALDSWLETCDSKDVGQKRSSGAESTGHASGRAIVAIMRKKKADIDDDDLAQIKRTVSSTKRHLAQKPEKESVAGSKWESSLKNWGHDPSNRKPARLASGLRSATHTGYFETVRNVAYMNG